MLCFDLSRCGVRGISVVRRNLQVFCEKRSSIRKAPTTHRWTMASVVRGGSSAGSTHVGILYVPEAPILGLFHVPKTGILDPRSRVGETGDDQGF